MDGPKSMAVLKDIERHFGKDIVKLDAEVLFYHHCLIYINTIAQDVDEIEKLTQD